MEYADILKNYEQDHIYIADNSASVLNKLLTGLPHCGLTAEGGVSIDLAFRYIEHNHCDLLVISSDLADDYSESFINHVKNLRPETGVLLMVKRAEIGTALKHMQNGVIDYICKPFDILEFVLRIRTCLDRIHLNRENALLSKISEPEAEIPDETEDSKKNRTKGQSVTQKSLAALITALESKDEFTHNHSARVSEVALMLAKEIRPADKQFHAEIRFAGLLHDIGKIGVHETVINKPSALTPREFAEIRSHPVIGEAVLRPLIANPVILAIVRNHHERWDGSGYPDHLKGNEIPLGARVVAVADSYDAMISARPFRVAMTHERAVQILQEGAGIQWDRQLILAFMNIARNEDVLKRVRTVVSHREKALPSASNTLLPPLELLKLAG